MIAFGKAVFIISVCDAVMLLLFLLLGPIVGERNWLMILFLYQPPVVNLVPPVGLLLFSLAMRQKAAAMINLSASLLVLLFVMQFHIHVPRGGGLPEEREEPLRVLTYNIDGGAFGASAVVRVLKDSKADIIFLQEARQGSSKKLPDPGPTIAAALPGWHQARRGEVMIVSRFPLLKTESQSLAGFRKCLLCEINWHKQTVSLIDIHLSTAASGESLSRNWRHFRGYLTHTSAVRREQIVVLQRLIRSQHNPIIVSGDFNSTPSTYAHRVLKNHLADCFEEAGWGYGYTYSASLPVWRIDYIFTSKEFVVADCRTLSARASDHRPVLATLLLRSR